MFVLHRFEDEQRTERYSGNSCSERKKIDVCIFRLM